MCESGEFGGSKAFKELEDGVYELDGPGKQGWLVVKGGEGIFNNGEDNDSTSLLHQTGLTCRGLLSKYLETNSPSLGQSVEGEEKEDLES